MWGEDLYEIWYEQNKLKSWSTAWDGHDALYNKLNDAAVYELNKILVEAEPMFINPVDVLWELSKDTIDLF